MTNSALPFGKDIVYLVSCVATKRQNPARAEDLYQSDWFTKARQYVAKTDKPWYILSAQYGLVSPGEIIEPYERSLNFMTAAERSDWGKMIHQQIRWRLPRTAQIILLAGRHYRVPIEAHFSDRLTVPMRHLGIGQQKAWLLQQIEYLSSLQNQGAL